MDESRAVKESGASFEIDAPQMRTIRRLVRRTPRRRPLRDIGERFLNGSSLSVRDVNVLLTYLSDQSGARWRAKELTAHLLGYAAVDTERRDAATDALLDVLTRSHRYDRLGRGWRGVIRAAKFSLAIAGIGMFGGQPLSPGVFWTV